MSSSTTVFGDALIPFPHEPAAWIDESDVPVSKDIYATMTTMSDSASTPHRGMHQPGAAIGPNDGVEPVQYPQYTTIVARGERF